MENSAGYDISVITDQLFLGSLPRDRAVADIRALHIDLVISMLHRTPPEGLADPPAIRAFVLPTFDFPLTPIPLAALRRGVAEALPVLEAGGRVLVYCRQGRHRSVVMTCAILIARGMTADEAMATVMAHRAVADPHAFYIEPRIRAFERDWNSTSQP